MLRITCGGGGTSIKIRSDCGTEVTGGKKGGGDGENLIPSPLITFCNRPIFPCLVSKSKMATPQTQTLTVTGRPSGEKKTHVLQGILKENILTKTNLRTYAGNGNPSGKKHQKFEVMYLLGNLALWSSCKNASKSVMHVQINEELLFCLVNLFLSLLWYVFARSLMISFFYERRIRSIKKTEFFLFQ